MTGSPTGAEGAERWGRVAGFTPVTQRGEGICPSPSGERGPCEVRRLRGDLQTPPAAAHDPEASWLLCPVCELTVEFESCHTRCPRCHALVESCSDGGRLPG